MPMARQTIFRVLPPPTPTAAIALPPIPDNQKGETQDSEVFDLHRMCFFQEHAG
jgi:hypothetical protein